MKIPIFVIVHNHFEILKKSVLSYEKYIKTPIEIIFHDTASVYFETLNYLKEKENNGYKVYRSNNNHYYTVINSVKDYLSKNPDCQYVVITDPNIELYNVNGDILEFYIHILNKLNKTSVGPMLEISDILSKYNNKEDIVKEDIVKEQISKFWNKPYKEILFGDNKYQYIECSTNPTFQIFSIKNIPINFPYNNSICVLSPYSARYLDWYIGPNNITPVDIFCYFKNSNISHWYNEKNKTIFNNLEIKYNYIYYFNKCKCRNNYNFGDFITPFIYEQLTNKKPILDINGGKNKKDVIFGAGSILKKSQSNSIIWGTGFIKENEGIKKPKKILSVRGPLTRKQLLKLGHDCPETYGDIGMILPYFYYPEIKKKYKLGIIPHYIDKEKFNTIYPNYDNNIKIIDVTEPIQTVITNILECEMTTSSSLHGIIVSHAYGIKCMWLRITDKICGGNFKFHDYYGSLNMKKYKDIKPYQLNTKISTDKLINLINGYPNPLFPINTKHIIELCPFIKIF